MPSSRLVRFIAILPVVTTMLATGCSKAPAPPASAAPAATPPALPSAMPAHQTAPGPTAAMPADASGSNAPDPTAAAPAAGPGATRTATGTVVETMNAGGYTYVRIDTGTETIWAATAPIKVKVGQRLTVPLDTPMRNFHSDKLRRDFPLIYFVSAVSRGTGAPESVAMTSPAGGATPSAAGQALPEGHPAIGQGGAARIKVTEVMPPPKGGHSVANLWAQRTALAGKPVVVRGTVVKFLSGIMGRNWVHLQDGSGDAGDGTNDITVTTSAEAKPGEVVTATGTLAIDRDFGAGYRYGVIVEGATLTK